MCAACNYHGCAMNPNPRARLDSRQARQVAQGEWFMGQLGLEPRTPTL